MKTTLLIGLFFVTALCASGQNLLLYDVPYPATSCNPKGQGQTSVTINASWVTKSGPYCSKAGTLPKLKEFTTRLPVTT
jgi:hypothetical protein